MLWRSTPPTMGSTRWAVARGETPDDPDPEREERPPGLPPAPPEPDDGLDVD